MMVVQSETPRQLCHLYDARMIEGLSSEAYCIVRFEGGVCVKVDMVKVKASEGQK
jgi:hypothetical protein